MENDERIEEKRRELTELLDGVPDTKRKIVDDLTSQAAFLAVTLEDLADSISKNGTTEVYTNGEHQQGQKMSSDAKLYGMYISRYSAIVTKLLNMAPNKRRETPEDLINAEVEKRVAEITEDKGYEYLNARNDAFIAAVKAGTADHLHYTDFMKKYDAEHGHKSTF